MSKNKSRLKLKQFSSNKAIYTQFLLNHKVLITTKNNFYSKNKECSELNKVKKHILNLYNNKSIKYNTLEYLLIQNKLKFNNSIIELKKKNMQLSIEHSIESGLEYI